jgi:(p)ppGpp synthase/HD superfamily hydrolase
MFSRRFDRALTYAADVHRLQRRKGTEIPYIGHLLGVASAVIDNRGTEDEAIAALLHDAPEDHGGEARLADVRTLFGARVAEIVEGCSDALDADPRNKAPWFERKMRYIEHLKGSSDVSVYLVSASDKLHNARSTARDFAAMGSAVFERFNRDAGADGTLWYYGALIQAYRAKEAEDERRKPIVDELASVIEGLRAAAHLAPHADLTAVVMRRLGLGG